MDYLERGPVGATCITGAPALRPPLRRSAERDLRAASFEIFDTQVLDFSIRPRRVHVIVVHSQSDHTCNCRNFLFFIDKNFSTEKICTAQSEISGFVKSMKLFFF